MGSDPAIVDGNGQHPRCSPTPHSQMSQPRRSDDLFVLELASPDHKKIAPLICILCETTFAPASPVTTTVPVFVSPRMMLSPQLNVITLPAPMYRWRSMKTPRPSCCTPITRLHRCHLLHRTQPGSARDLPNFENPHLDPAGHHVGRAHVILGLLYKVQGKSVRLRSSI